MSAAVLPCVVALCLVLAGMPAGAAQAQPVTIYRCTDAAGNLSVQNQPCPAGSRTEIRRMEGVGAAPTATPAVPSPLFPAASDGSTATMAGTGDAQEPPRILDSATLRRDRTADTPADTTSGQRLPPPPIFRCTTYDNDSYLAEEEEQPPRCIALRTVGLDGNPAMGAGQACEVKRDQCARVPDGGACEAWARLTREAESRWRFAHPDNEGTRREAYERLARIVAESSCGG